MTLVNAPVTAAPMAARWPMENPSPAPGRSTMITPTSPTSTATPRRMPTFSPKSGIAIRVISSGMAKKIA